MRSACANAAAIRSDQSEAGLFGWLPLRSVMSSTETFLKGRTGKEVLLMRVALTCTIFVLSRFVVGLAHDVKNLNLIPAPQYVEPLKADLLLDGSRMVRIVTEERPDPKVALASNLLKEDFERRDSRLRGKLSIEHAAERGSDVIYLLAGASEAARHGIKLNLLDEQALSPRFFGQSYVLRSDDPKMLSIIGSSPLGVLYGAMTLLQLAREEAGGLRIPGIYIRDYPDFEFRAAADWLLNGEGTRWSLDRGLGWEGFEALVRRKLDQCLSYKINMIVFDGFGWGLRQRAPQYPSIMRRLTTYARARGIHLVFGGYGASYGIVYQQGPLYEGTPYLGEVFFNRETYPD